MLKLEEVVRAESTSFVVDCTQGGKLEWCTGSMNKLQERRFCLTRDDLDFVVILLNETSNSQPELLVSPVLQDLQRESIQQTLCMQCVWVTKTSKLTLQFMAYTRSCDT